MFVEELLKEMVNKTLLQEGVLQVPPRLYAACFQWAISVVSGRALFFMDQNREKINQIKQLPNQVRELQQASIQQLSFLDLSVASHEITIPQIKKLTKVFYPNFGFQLQTSKLYIYIHDGVLFYSFVPITTSNIHEVKSVKSPKLIQKKLTVLFQKDLKKLNDWEANIKQNVVNFNKNYMKLKQVNNGFGLTEQMKHEQYFRISDYLGDDWKYSGLISKKNWKQLPAIHGIVDFEGHKQEGDTDTSPALAYDNSKEFEVYFWNETEENSYLNKVSVFMKDKFYDYVRLSLSSQVEHELAHVLQFAFSRHFSGGNYKETTAPNYNFGQPKDKFNSKDEGVPYLQQSSEFLPQIISDVHEFEYLRKRHPEVEPKEIFLQMVGVNKFTLNKDMFFARDFFMELKKNDFPRYKEAIKKFYTELQTRGLFH